MVVLRNFRKKRAFSLGTPARSTRWAQRPVGMMGATARNRRCYRRQNGRSMPLGTIQDTGKALPRPFDHRVTHGGHGKTAKSAEEAIRTAKRPLGRSAAPTESPLHAPRACPTLRDSLSPHAGIGGNAWGTAPRSKRRPNVGRLPYYIKLSPNIAIQSV